MGRVDISAFQVGITYRRDGDLHVFTSDEVEGLAIATSNLDAAIAELPRALERLLSKNYGLTCWAGWSAPFAVVRPTERDSLSGRHAFALPWDEVYHHHVVVCPVESAPAR
ncbi:MAG: hypothetical protein HQL40_14480 [Alphaproteobacteria bacterium]|nr:hypothetical protein [Alphaproteobacteria bacterium]